MNDTKAMIKNALILKKSGMKNGIQIDRDEIEIILFVAA